MVRRTQSDFVRESRSAAVVRAAISSSSNRTVRKFSRATKCYGVTLMSASSTPTAPHHCAKFSEALWDGEMVYLFRRYL